MRRDLKDKIRAAAAQSGLARADFDELLDLVDQHYDKLEATLAQSMLTSSLEYHTPIESIFDSVTRSTALGQRRRRHPQLQQSLFALFRYREN